MADTMIRIFYYLAEIWFEFSIAFCVESSIALIYSYIKNIFKISHKNQKPMLPSDVIGLLGRVYINWRLPISYESRIVLCIILEAGNLLGEFHIFSGSIIDKSSRFWIQL